MVGKKKSLSGQKEQIQADTGEDGKENRDKGPERDVARRRGGAPRRGRGSSRGRECESLRPSRTCLPSRCSLQVGRGGSFFIHRVNYFFCRVGRLLFMSLPPHGAPNGIHR